MTTRFRALIAEVAEARFITKKLARDVFDDFLFGLALELRNHGRVVVPGLGVFRIATRKARRIRNPITKELMQIPETKSVRFRASKKGHFGGGK